MITIWLHQGQRSFSIGNADLRQKMGKAAREKAEREFSIDIVIEKHLNIYNELIEK